MITLPRIALLASLAAVLAIAVYVVLEDRSHDGLPEDLSQITPSSEFINPEASIAYYRERVRREPDAAEPRVRLAHALMQHARTTGREAEYLPEARRMLGEALDLEPNHFYGRTILAALYNTLHRFEAARTLSNVLIAEYPQHAFTHGTLVDALVELGEYEAAVEAADRMLSIRPGLPSYARAAYLRELHGDTEGAIEAMRLAAEAEPMGREGRLWALLQLGSLYLGAAKPDTAAFIFEGILQEHPDFAPAVGALGHVALAKGNTDEAIARLEEARLMQPRGEFDELLAEAYALAGREEEARAAEDRVLQGLREAHQMGEIVETEEADLLADRGEDLARAVRLARRQVERRPGHLHANETMAWTLFRTGQATEAIHYIERALRLGTRDAMVHYRAARIYEAAGQMRVAERHLRTALEANLHVESPSSAEHAHTLLATLETRAPVQTARVTASP